VKVKFCLCNIRPWRSVGVHGASVTAAQKYFAIIQARACCAKMRCALLCWGVPVLVACR
jgi:hypothetical protein